MKGKFILIVGPSGSGKGEILEHLRSKLPGCVFPVSLTTRGIRPAEKEGITYRFVSREEFKRSIKEGMFLEWAKYGGNLYGTPKNDVLSALEKDKTVIREMEIQGARSILSSLPQESVRVIFISGGSWDALEKRITARAPLSADELERRRKRYLEEKNFSSEADYVVENPDGGLAVAKERVYEIVSGIINPVNS